MGLSPQYYDGCTDDVLNLYAELEDRIISDVVRCIVKTGDITETAKWQIRQARQMGLLYDDIIKDIAKSTNKTDSEVKKMFEKAGVETVNNDNRLHIQTGKSPLDIRQSDLDKLNAKDIKYNGKMYFEYEISQMLRGMERQSRALKRQKVAFKTAIDEGQTFLKSDLTALNGKIRDKSAQIQSFCSETGYKRDRFRESINPKTSVGHASRSAQKYKETLKNGLTSNQNSSNIFLRADYKSSYNDNNTYGNRNIELPEKLQNYLRVLTNENDFIEGKKDDFIMKDLSSLSKETGVEFARVIIENKTYLMRGNSTGTNISNDMLENMKKYNGTLDYHSHPHDDDNVPSPSDLKVMSLLEDLTGQQESQIVTTNGKTTTYNKFGIVSVGTVDNTISDEDKKMFEELFGGLF